ncbi:anaphase-promoting complex subunit Apc3 [Schizosaccharomyces cryophilus OY26]|uniref:Anaphase-promoting complex subunit Apc3 n=1 Tax=Schizosaccharomyces cryophilus (strain OY26 / ATCC MYA-4695 / CBS 11777 / NBRC 106824 / NRRL Y48691) TaxID=653667 RepID=S9W1Y9_SCHCR|nr:anaphase-promoting complex subunit Apc3 [Schizosaccharomyces cryophilus OY26]EPY52354.1 anaphase-promoting complex subunit Apc3 [Schizosaccharomyces cryophilus OY26]
MLDRLKCLVWYSIDNQQYKNAIFYAERLHAIEDSGEGLYLLAYSHLLNLDYNIAFDLLNRNVKHIPCVFVYAKVCLILGRYKQGITTIETCRPQWKSILPNLNDPNGNRGRPDASSMLDVLGLMYKKAGYIKKATECFVESISINPYNFNCFQNLIAIGIPLDVDNIFILPPYLNAPKPLEKIQSDSPLIGSDTYSLKRGKKSFPSLPKQTTPKFPVNPSSSSSISAFTNWFDRIDNTALDSHEVEEEGSKEEAKSNLNLAPYTDLSKPSTGSSSVRKDFLSKNEIASAKLSTSKAGARFAAKLREASNKRNEGELPVNYKDEDVNLLELLKIFAKGCYSLARYQLRDALSYFLNLPREHRTTPFVLSKIGVTYFEMVNYEKAEEVFQKLRDIRPSQVTDMEIYSTALWHLQKSVPLSYLAHEMLEASPYSPEAWCILANCFSLQREHSQALKCINRALQLDPTFEYAYTLQGHEHSANEEYEKSKTSFRKAIRINARHYNAWYGLGMVYLKTGRNDQADFHFQRAAEINSNNSVLTSCIGMIFERGKDFGKALEFYCKACELDEKSSLARFKKAKVLILLHDYDKALTELERLKSVAPDEANVHFMLGKIYKQRGQKNLAMRHLTIAWNLDGKANHIIKESIENLDVPEENLLTETGEIYKNYDN